MSKRKRQSKPVSQNNIYRSVEIDVVVTTAGRFDCLSKCLNALERESKNVSMNVIIIDNGSPQEDRNQHSDLFIKRDAFQSFSTKRLPQNIGFPRGANEGARMGRAPLIMFLSDDVELHEGALEKVIERMKDSSIGITGIKLIFPPDSTSQIRPAGRVQHVGMALDIQSNPIHPLVSWRADNPKCCISREVWAVTGACLTIRRSLFAKAGGFDEDYGLGTFEDLSLCMATRMMGYKVFIEANATAFHYTGATAEKRKEAFPLQYNRTIFNGKWANSGLLSYGRTGSKDTLSEVDFW